MSVVLKDFKQLGEMFTGFEKGKVYTGFTSVTYIPEKEAETKEFKKGYIFMADLSPSIGREQDGYRPVLIVSNDIGNKFSSIVTVIPISKMVHNLKRPDKANMPTHVFLSKEETGLHYDSEIMCEHFRTLDKERLKNFLCFLDDKTMKEVKKCIKISLDLDQDLIH